MEHRKIHRRRAVTCWLLSTLLGTALLAEEDAVRGGNTLLGKVVDLEGRPVAGAEVRMIDKEGRRFPPADRRLQRLSRSRLASIETTAEGIFLMTGLPTKSGWKVMISHPDYRDEKFFGVVAKGPDRPVVFKLTRSFNLRGLVLDPAGRSAPGARVELSWRVGGQRSAHGIAIADEEGWFLIEEVTAGQGEIFARSPLGRSPVKSLELDDELSRRPVQLTLEQSPAIRGRLFSPQGDPVERGWVKLKGTKNKEARVSDAEGRFFFGGLLVGDYELMVEHPDYGRITTRVRLDAGMEKELEMAFEEGDRSALQIAGRVFDSAGRGVDGAVLTLDGRASARPVSFQSRPDGGFELQAPEPGRYRLTVEHPDYAGHRAELTFDDTAVEDLEIELIRGSRLSGRIHGLDADQLAELELLARGPGGTVEAQLSQDGTYRIDRLSPGRWSVSATLRSPYRSVGERLSLEGYDRTLDLHFDAGHRLRGVVLQNGLPQHFGQISASCYETSFASVHVSTELDEQGRFVFAGLPTSTCRLQVSPARGSIESSFSRTLEIAGDQDIVIEREPLAGVVRGAVDHQGVACSRIQLRQLGTRIQGAPLSASCDGQGRFHFDDVQEGAWQLQVMADGFAILDQRIEVDELRAEPELFLTPADPLVIILHDASSVIPYEVSIRISGLTSRGFYAHQDLRPGPDGKIQVPSPPPGVYKVRVLAVGRTAQPIEIQVPGEPVQVFLTDG